MKKFSPHTPPGIKKKKKKTTLNELRKRKAKMGMVTRNGVLEMIVVELSILAVDVGWQKWGLGQRLLLYYELSFMTFDITPRRPILEWLQGVKL